MTTFHGTTILSVRKGNNVVIAGDGQVTLGQTIMKPNARKVRRTYHGKVVAGFAGLRRMLLLCLKNLMKNWKNTPGI